MSSPEFSHASWLTAWLWTAGVASTGAAGRLILLSLAGARPSGIVEAVEQAWVGAVWLCVVFGAGWLLSTGIGHTFFWGVIWSLISSAWDVLIELPFSAALGLVVPYFISAMVLPVLGVSAALARPKLGGNFVLNVQRWYPDLRRQP